MGQKATQESRKNHYVPVFYLKQWKGGDGKIHVIRNINGKIVRSANTPDHLGFEYHLYSYHGHCQRKASESAKFLNQ